MGSNEEFFLFSVRMSWRQDVSWDWEKEFTKPIPERVYNNWPWSREKPKDAMTPAMPWQRFNVLTGKAIWLPYNQDEHIEPPPLPVPWYDKAPWSRKNKWCREWEVFHEDGETMLILEDFLPSASYFGAEKSGRVFKLTSEYTTREEEVKKNSSVGAAS